MNDVANATSRQAERKSGAVVYLDASSREVCRLSFSNALITEVGFPALEAGQNEPAIMTVRLTCASTRRHRDSAGRTYNLNPNRGPSWLVSSFRLNLDGLGETTSRTVRIEELIVRGPNPGSLAVPDLVITFPASSGQPMEAWLEDFVIKGNNGDAQKKSGTLEWLSPDLREVFGTLSFEHLGIHRLDPVMFDTGNRTLHLLQAQMYCENLRLEPHPAWG